MNILIIEDSKNRIDWFKRHYEGNNIHLASCVWDAKMLLESHTYDLIHFDHDLLDYHYDCTQVFYAGTGKEIADWMVKENNNQKSEIIIHSLNDEGAEYILDVLSKKGYNVRRKTVLEFKAPIS